MTIAANSTVLSKLDQLLKIVDKSPITKARKEAIEFLLEQERREAWAENLPTVQITEKESREIEASRKEIRDGKGFRGTAKEAVEWLNT